MTWGAALGVYGGVAGVIAFVAAVYRWLAVDVRDRDGIRHSARALVLAPVWPVLLVVALVALARAARDVWNDTGWGGAS